MRKTLITSKEVINSGLVRSAPIDARFDSLLLDPHLQEAEDRFVRSVICEDLFVALLTEKADTVSNYNPAFPIVPAFTTAKYEKLWTEHLLQLYSYAVIYQALPFIAMKISSNGILINNTEFAGNAGEKGVVFLQDTMMETITEKQKRLVKFLKDNNADYNCYTEQECENSANDISKKLGIIFY